MLLAPVLLRSFWKNNCRTIIFNVFCQPFFIWKSLFRIFRSIKLNHHDVNYTKRLEFLNNSFLAYKFTMKSVKQIIAMISYILWWLHTKIIGTFFGILSIFSNLYVVPTRLILLKKNLNNQHFFYMLGSQNIKTNPLNGMKK
jgi:membrane-bound acyltransferase YfiQ involved in biofilm formation